MFAIDLWVVVTSRNGTVLSTSVFHTEDEAHRFMWGVERQGDGLKTYHAKHAMYFQPRAMP